MIDKKLHEITSRLDHAFIIADNIADDEIKSHLAKYLCVLTSGYLEESIRIIIEQYASQKASPEIVYYISNAIKGFTNLNSEKIESFLCTFNPKWGENFCNFLTDEERAAIDSIRANRNRIAHGKNVGVSYIIVKNWYKDVKCIINDLRSLLSV